MKSILVRVAILALIAIFFGTGVVQAINYVETKLITLTIELMENSEFIHEIRTMVREIVEEVLFELIREGEELRLAVAP